jgi:hypothetical protein
MLYEVCCEVLSRVTADGRSVSTSRCRAHSGTCDQILYFLSDGYDLKVAVLSLWDALSDERSGLSFVILSL